MATTTYLRTSIILENHTIDLQLPAESPVEDVVFELVRDLHRTLVERGIEDDANWLYDPDAVWSLELFGRRQLDGEKSLAEQDVLDGSRLWLNKNAKNETYPALIDDIAESVANYQEQFPEWSYEIDATRYASAFLGVLPAIALIGMAYLTGWGLHGDVPYRWEFVAVSGFITVLASVLGVILSRGDNFPILRVSLVSVGYLGVACTSFMCIPRGPSLWHFPMVTGCLLVYAAVILPLTRKPIVLHAAVITAAFTVLIVSSVNFFYHSSPSVVAIECATLAYLFILFSSRPAMMSGRVETPYVPAAGEAFTKGETSITDISHASSSGEVIESVINQKKQNYAAHEYLLGILIGGLAVIIASIGIAGVFLRDREISVFFLDLNEKWVLVLYVVCISFAMVLRARNYIDRDVHTILLVSAVLMIFAYLAALSVTNSQANIKEITVVATLFGVVTLVGSLWALGQKEIRSPITRRWLEILENFVYAFPVLWLGWMMNVYMMVRNR